MKTAVRILYELDEAMSYVGYCNYEYGYADNVVDKAAWRIQREAAYESVMAEVERFIEALATGADEGFADKADKALAAGAAE